MSATIRNRPSVRAGVRATLVVLSLVALQAMFIGGANATTDPDVAPVEEPVIDEAGDPSIDCGTTPDYQTIEALEAWLAACSDPAPEPEPAPEPAPEPEPEPAPEPECPAFPFPEGTDLREVPGECIPEDCQVWPDVIDSSEGQGGIECPDPEPTPEPTPEPQPEPQPEPSIHVVIEVDPTFTG